MFRFAIFCCRAFVDILPSETGIMSKNASFFTCAANQITAEALDYNKVHEQWWYLQRRYQQRLYEQRQNEQRHYEQRQCQHQRR